MFYDLASTSWGDEELEAIRRVCQSDRYTMGDQVRSFENAFASKFGMKHAVMVNSGSSANLVAVAALCYKRERPLQRGDEVIVPAISWATTRISSPTSAPIAKLGSSTTGMRVRTARTPSSNRSTSSRPEEARL